jgi:hypothetical protein
MVITCLVASKLIFSDSGSNGTKEINERRIKTPKMMQIFLGKIIMLKKS